MRRLVDETSDMKKSRLTRECWLEHGATGKSTSERSLPALYLMSNQKHKDAVVKTTKIEWMVCRVVLSPAISRVLNAVIVDGTIYKFPLCKHRTRSHTVSAGVQPHWIVFDINDIVPNQTLADLLTHEAHIGNFKLSPYKLEDYGLQSIELTVDGVPVGK